MIKNKGLHSGKPFLISLCYSTQSNSGLPYEASMLMMDVQDLFHNAVQK
ncbi:MAG TPA: hypothetical protein VFS36_11280 [Chitinophagaceae bacterium]|jgi:hypothetical protein|nr:hypothetical protein [Chitinophagaceae bacterium]